VRPGVAAEGTPSPPIERIACRLLRLPEGAAAFEPDGAEAWLQTSGAAVLRTFRLARTPAAAARFSTVVEREYRQDYNFVDGTGARILPPIIAAIRAGFSGQVSAESGLAYNWTALRMQTFTTDLGGSKVTIDLPEIAVARGEAPLAEGLTLHPVAGLEGGGKLALLVGRE